MYVEVGVQIVEALENLKHDALDLGGWNKKEFKLSVLQLGFACTVLLITVLGLL